jgi:hypothetical protein
MASIPVLLNYPFVERDENRQLARAVSPCEDFREA